MSPERPVTVRWLTAAAWLSLIVFACTATLLSVSLEKIGAGLGIGLEKRGALASIRAGALALSVLISGLGSDRFGKKWFLTGGMFVITVALLWTSTARSYAALVGGLVMMGFGLGTLEALTSPLIAEMHTGRLSVHMNVLHAFYPVGIVMSSLAIGGALSAGVAWQAPFAVVAAPAVLVGLMYLTGRYKGDGGGPRRGPLTVWQVLRMRTFYLLALAMFFGAGCEGGLFYWIPNYYQSRFGVTPMAAAGALTLFSATMAVGRFGLGAASRVVPLPRLMLGLTALGVLVSAGLAWAGGLTASLALVGVAGAAVAFFWPGILTLAAERIEAGSSTLFAMLAAVGIAGFGLMPHAIGIVGEAYDDLGAGLMVVPAAFAVAGGMLWIVFAKAGPERVR